ncbi:isopentenyl phosphate kinase [Saccharolobus islandicus]|uniref:Isopentenyl phosphate kinase n=5 Tax=Saccharolobus islandicus TaxID=43080 RepID=M9U8K0_SACIS|nr:isopentenyl phosphate kinase [Sulfolobus islandicus]ACP38797.1 aspartate/glutamate/uridylate kinase [Sulfolobus islandicus M.14.25]ACP56002.1 aspartate/glutamate/uridylate kinase [Sulfolobus islandicus M.16.27]ACR42665.1 aspartate/glutamate/uridylate kinase [Sulfolobus islandicus M.16.4]ADX83348.1 aspartate/glutamate/uridylate kinase [Sulfolobus islandicus HVE10/4]AGJ63354.1 putative archaeal kinase [Sulfolobus islandicus LAL14/1]
MDMGSELAYDYRVLKLGGSLITCKDLPRCVRLELLRKVSEEIKKFVDENPNEKIILLHGGGSFGHYEASIFDDSRTVRTSEAMQELNYMVTKQLLKSGINVISIPGKFYTFDIVLNALEKGLVPLIYGDIKFDASIISADDMSIDIAKKLNARLLFAIDKAGILGRDGRVISELRRIDEVGRLLQANYYDVTGGISSKIQKIFENNLNAMIFDGSKAGNIYLALKGYNIGTLVRGNPNA